MSISLNDHENRILSLEQYKSKVVPVLSNVSVSQSISLNLSEYPLYVVNVAPLGNRYVQYTMVCGRDCSYDCWQDAHHQFGFVLRSDKLEVLYNYGKGCMVTDILGLKLYYSFSYNIIYRATHLLEKIFYVLNKGGVSLWVLV